MERTIDQQQLGWSVYSSTYQIFTREDWSELRKDTPMTLDDTDLHNLAGIIEYVSLREVTEVYLPLSRLLNLHVHARQTLHAVREKFLNTSTPKVPYIIGIAGSVAAGKSTTARIIQALLSRWPNHPKVDLVTTDGFLYPNDVLEQKQLMHRKGFPESFDLKRLVQFLLDVKSGCLEVKAPVYSHLTYDILAGESFTVNNPDILIVEGLNVLQHGRSDAKTKIFISDFFDFSLYVDADEKNLEQWYIKRFLRLCETSFRDTSSYFKEYSTLSTEEATQMASRIWKEINGKNLTEHIKPTRERARLIMKKEGNHVVEKIWLKKI
ncbi:MAG: type I pantothenate kinase [SAR324 cluster bacterium]|nr:type I pantothenate kinase [SAR324 cluster bacterium]